MKTILLAALLVSCSTAQKNEPVPAATVTNEPPALPSWEEIAATYKDDLRLAVSAKVAPYVYMSCRMPAVGSDIPYHSIPDVPRITVYVNETAWPAMQEEGERSFLIGSLIVKDKSPRGIGIMRKDANGWTYGFVDETGRASVGQAELSHCKGCHEHGTVPNDFQPEPGTGLKLGDPRDAVFLTAPAETTDPP